MYIFDPEQNDEQTVDLPVIWDDMALMWSCDVIVMRFVFSHFLRRPIAVLWGTRQSLNNQPFPGIDSSWICYHMPATTASRPERSN